MLAYILTLGRLVLAAIFACCVASFVNQGQISNTLAVALIVLAIIEELTDIFDGWAARRFGTVSQLGGILDPLVDSLARATIYFAMAHVGWIPHAVPLVMIARDIIVAYTRIANATVGASTSARISGKIKAIIQGGGIPVVIALAAPVVTGALGPDTVHIFRLTAAGILIAITVWSLYDYLRGAWPAIRRMKNL
ncbi:MAG: CDP-alcohol phosphatidyltransferase family protein [Phycisphaerales bacterium]|jgi:CDP-diacylglycerol---glycerol-3-phosphate 3-phosphatidyltransferase|nr:CDP-alcohol phosphatidyltransferase family protein [Phycisphaerales bacterium]